MLLVILWMSFALVRARLGPARLQPAHSARSTSLLVYWVHIEFVYGKFSIVPKRVSTAGVATLGSSQSSWLCCCSRWRALSGRADRGRAGGEEPAGEGLAGQPRLGQGPFARPRLDLFFPLRRNLDERASEQTQSDSQRLRLPLRCRSSRKHSKSCRTRPHRCDHRRKSNAAPGTRPTRASPARAVASGPDFRRRPGSAPRNDERREKRTGRPHTIRTFRRFQMVHPRPSIPG